ncbi:translation initiation factor IF-2 [Rubricella aquisinus]|uniref:Translation initiation factor IF-2 n=1 Tax=Rubricella aquisinus TaxID=2028108 RepID=A0A840WS26_9RHOB|nr:translation initiation factor IF-2 [Rubricella aquisinus]MBB5514020.1 translation initiation factor IF-2 [Rubricella aquisinus]
MSDSKSGDGNNGKTLGVRGGGSGPSHVRQSFSHGRTKSVLVEKKRKRVVVPKTSAASAGASSTPATGQGSDAASKPDPKLREQKAKVAGGRSLSDQEFERRRQALRAAQAQEADRRAKEREEEERRKAELDELRAEKDRAEREAREKIEQEKIAAERAAIEAAEKAKEEAPAPAREKSRPAPKAEEMPDPATLQAKAEEAPRRGKKTEPRPEVDKTARPKGGDDRRRSGKLTINQALGGEGNRGRSMAAMKRRAERDKRRSQGSNEPREKVVREVQLPEAITVQELANRMAERSAAVVKSLMQMGIMATATQTIDADTAELIIEEFGHKMVRVSDADVEDVIKETEDKPEDLKDRAPVITIMGHVDHGKTSLLDSIRKANVVSGEAGGITQHIGAYRVNTEGGHTIAFLDTPGHAAFTSMRARGAQVTDIVVLVVAADDSVMPQTIEAISHAKAANVPMIVAINKIDRPGADPNKVRTQLLQHEVVVEGMSGDVLDVEVSAHTGEGIDKLLEAIVLQSELMELKANPDRAAIGAVIEAKLDTGRGPVATVLVQNGTLKRGDIFVVGEQWGRVRALINDAGERVDEAGPSVPVEVLGLNGTPEAGDVLNVVPSEAEAREIAEYRANAAKEKKAAIGSATTLDQLLAKAKDDENVSELPIVVKADVQGSTEAIVQAMEKLGNDEVRIRVLHSGVGAITESDVTLAEASGVPIIGFNVRANAAARQAANQKGIELRYYSIIYDLVDDVKKAAEGLLSPEVKETFIGYATIKEVFKVSNVGKVAGCLVTEGVARRSAGVRLLRDNVVIHEGTLKTLKRFKDEVKEVQSGQECGMAFENYDDIRAADVIEIYETEEIKRSL